MLKSFDRLLGRLNDVIFFAFAPLTSSVTVADEDDVAVGAALVFSYSFKLRFFFNLNVFKCFSPVTFVIVT